MIWFLLFSVQHLKLYWKPKVTLETKFSIHIYDHSMSVILLAVCFIPLTSVEICDTGSTRLHSTESNDLLLWLPKPKSSMFLDHFQFYTRASMNNLINCWYLINNWSFILITDNNVIKLQFLLFFTFIKLFHTSFSKVRKFTVLMHCRTVDCIIIYRKSGVEIEYFLEEYSLMTSKVMATSH